MLYVSEGCQAGGCPVVVTQRQQKAAKSIETRFFHRWRATTVFQKLTAEAQAPGIAPDASLEYSALY